MSPTSYQTAPPRIKLSGCEYNGVPVVCQVNCKIILSFRNPAIRQGGNIQPAVSGTALQQRFDFGFQGIQIGFLAVARFGPDADLFVAAAGAGEDVQVGFGQAQQLGQKPDALFVGFAFHGRGGELDLEGIAVDAGDHVTGCAGLDIDLEDDTVGGFPDIGHGRCLSPSPRPSPAAGREKNGWMASPTAGRGVNERRPSPAVGHVLRSRIY